MSNNNLEKVDFSSMTKEEVIAYFKSKNAKLEQDKAQLVQDAKRQARDIKRLDRKSQKLEDKNKELTKKANKLEKKLATTISVTIEWYVENGDTRTLANLQVLQSKLNHPRQ